MDLNLLQLHGDVGGKKPKGDAVVGDVRSGKTFSNADETELIGTIPVRASAAQSVTPDTSNIVKAAGIYDGDITILGDPDLVAANVKAGANIFGVSGKMEVVDTTEATNPIIAGNILINKVAFINGAKVTGSMADNGAVSITPGTTAKAIAAGYHNGSGSVVGDAELVAGNIKSGITLFGVSGNVKAVDSDILFAPKCGLHTEWQNGVYTNEVSPVGSSWSLLDDGMTMTHDENYTNSVAMAVTKTPVDLTNVNRVYIAVQQMGSGISYQAIGGLDTTKMIGQDNRYIGDYMDRWSIIDLPTGKLGIIELQANLHTGLHYIYAGCYYSMSSVKVHNVWLVR